MADGRGGPRPGSGRPRSTVVHESAVRKAETKIRDRLPWLVDSLFAEAEGIWVEEIMPDGETRTVYKTPPNLKSIIYLVDRVMGKPKQAVDVTSDGEPLYKTYRENDMERL